MYKKALHFAVAVKFLQAIYTKQARKPKSYLYSLKQNTKQQVRITYV